MIELLIPTLLLIVGLSLLVWGADKLVFGAAALAKNFGISPLVIGMTILAMGSSAPEMVVSAAAALDGKIDTSIGNVIGSNIANIALILGITALIKPLAISSGIIRRELPLMLIVTILSGILMSNNYVSIYEGILLIVLFVIFIFSMLMISRQEQKNNKELDILLAEQQSEIPEGIANGTALIWVIIGLFLLPLGANMLVDNSVIIAKYFGMSDLVIGLTIIALGTSLPELAASIAGILKGEDDMAVGNIIGSNIFNILAVMGIPALISPGPISEYIMNRDFYVMLGISILLLFMALGKKRQINRYEGSLLVLCFAIYQGILFYNMP